jgi:hypothetical protein
MAPRPTLAGFLVFVRDQMGIPVSALPDGSQALVWAYEVSLDTVSLKILHASPRLYLVAVYNLAGDTLMNIAPDVTGSTFFSSYRAEKKLGNFVPGLIQSSSDEGTSESLMIPEALKNLTLSDLQNLKTPWGQAYLAIAQRAGTLWGLS